MAKTQANNTVPVVETDGSGGHTPYVRLDSSVPSTLAVLAMAQANDSTDAAFPAALPTVTTPVASATRAVITWDARFDSLLLLPFGIGADGNTFQVKVVGWAQEAGGEWFPTMLCQATCTISTALPGVAGQLVDNTKFFVKAISITNGIGIATDPVAGTQPEYLDVPVGNTFTFVEIMFNRNASATQQNALRMAH